jgi:hypothetical protein
MDKVHSPLILSAIRHRQNPSEYASFGSLFRSFKFVKQLNGNLAVVSHGEFERNVAKFCKILTN